MPSDYLRVRPAPSEHTLRVALHRVELTCRHAARATTAIATDPSEPALGWWSALVRLVHRRLTQRLDLDVRYLHPAVLTERAIAACADALAMKLPPSVRLAIERQHGALERDRRILLARARGADVSFAAQ